MKGPLEWRFNVGEPLTVPLVHQQEEVGTLVLAPKGTLTDDDPPLLDDLARTRPQSSTRSG